MSNQLLPSPGFIISKGSQSGTRLLFARDVSHADARRDRIRNSMPQGTEELGHFPLGGTGLGRIELLQDLMQLQTRLGTPQGEGIERLLAEVAQCAYEKGLKDGKK